MNDHFFLLFSVFIFTVGKISLKVKKAIENLFPALLKVIEIDCTNYALSHWILEKFMFELLYFSVRCAQ